MYSGNKWCLPFNLTKIKTRKVPLPKKKQLEIVPRKLAPMLLSSESLERIS